jgi:hemolysin activation/secretion protein
LGSELKQDPVKPGERLLPVERDLIKPKAPAADGAVSAPATTRVSRVLFEGAQAMPRPALDAAVAPWLNRAVTLADLRSMTVAVEQLYAQRGFLAVRVLIPQQHMQGGALTLHVIEGRYAPPKVNTATLREQAPLQRMVEHATCQAPCAEPSYVMSAEVDRALYLLNELPGIAAAATLKAGELPGTTLLDVDVAPIKHVSGYVGANNHGNRHTRRNQLNAGVALNSLLAVGDQLTLDGVSSTEALKHHTGLQQYGLGYNLPVGP